MKKIVPLLLILILVSAYIFYQKINQDKEYQESALQADVKTNPSPATNKYSLSEIETHNTKENCWLVIDGKVYDVTPYIADGMHPGKEAILEGCGKDATTLFNTRPMGSGTPHSNKARGYLDDFQVGDLLE